MLSPAGAQVVAIARRADALETLRDEAPEDRDGPLPFFCWDARAFGDIRDGRVAAPEIIVKPA